MKSLSFIGQKVINKNGNINTIISTKFSERYIVVLDDGKNGYDIVVAILRGLLHFENNQLQKQVEEKIEGEVVQTLKITEVEPNRNQPRKQFDEEALEELADSIKKYGLIQPIVVTKKEGYYQIVAGERRWRASKIAG